MVERLTGVALREYSIRETDGLIQELEEMKDTPISSLPERLQSFIINEQRLCCIDFRYWCKYAKIVTDRRREERFTPWPSQEFFLARVAREEERQWDAWLGAGGTGEFRFKGRFIFLKSRQVGATRVGNILGAHVTINSENTYSLIASDTPEKGLELWRLWDRLYSSLPWWLAPARDSRVKGEEQYFAGTNSTLVVGAGNQKASFGQGVTVDFFHLTEISRWNRDVIELVDQDLFWAFESSRKVSSIGILESTAEEGVGGWFKQQWDLSVREKSLFIPTFLGWFLCPEKFTLEDPSIVLTSETLALGKQIEERFPDVHLSTSQLRWYQSRRGEMEGKGKLGEFLSQVPSFPEEAFQFANKSIFSPSVIEVMSRGVQKPIQVKEWRGGAFVDATWDGDPVKADGLLLVWAPPMVGRTYYIAVDGAHGREGGDAHAVQVMAAPVGSAKAEQVAEWRGVGGGLASVGAVTSIAMTLGELYRDPITARPACIAPESNPGSPSAFVTLKLVEIGYSNIYIHRQVGRIRGEQLRPELGWQTTSATRTPLVLRGKEALDAGDILIRSPRVIAEMRTFEKKWTESGRVVRYEHSEGEHDDVLISLFIAYWVATEEFALMDAERSARAARVEEVKTPKWDPGMIVLSGEPTKVPGLPTDLFGRFY
jgi:hypothetical protein